MKFELEPYYRNISDQDFLSDLHRVAADLKLESLSTDEYRSHGKYNLSGIQKRFGSWTNALNLAGLELRKHPKLDPEALLEDLKRVAFILKQRSVTQGEYKSLGKYDSRPFTRAFGSWFGALEKAGLERTRNWGITEEEYFENIEEIWMKLGRQPKYSEIEKPLSKYSGGAYENRFGTWRKALEAFVQFVNKAEETPKTQPKMPTV